MSTSPDITIIGGGIIGVSTGIRLLAEGLATRIIDPCAADDPPQNMRTSEGNAGAFAFSEIFPLASPKIFRQAPKWLLDPDGPLSIPPRYAAQIAPWLLQFARMTRPSRYANGIRAQAALMEHSRATLDAFLRQTGTQGQLHKSGVLQIYASEAAFARAQSQRDIARDYGIEYEVLSDHDALLAHQPGLSSSARAGLFTPNWWRIYDPRAYLHDLTQFYLRQGGTWHQGRVQSLADASNGLTLQLEGTTLSTGRAIVAAGAWSHQLARALGEKIPLETERGYNATAWQNDFPLTSHIALGEHGFVIAPIGAGIRVGGAVELGGLKLPPNERRVDAMLKIAKTYLPELDMTGAPRWMGFRPTLPDSLPAIGASKSNPKVTYAFGHGHLGLTQSTGTADIVADLMQNRAPKIDIAAFNPLRFSRKP